MKKQLKKQIIEILNKDIPCSAKKYPKVIASQISELFIQENSDIIGQILILIEEEKTRIYNSDKFCEMEKAFGLLADLQEKIKKIR